MWYILINKLINKAWIIMIISEGILTITQIHSNSSVLITFIKAAKTDYNILFNYHITVKNKFHQLQGIKLLCIKQKIYDKTDHATSHQDIREITLIRHLSKCCY